MRSCRRTEDVLGGGGAGRLAGLVLLLVLALPGGPPAAAEEGAVDAEAYAALMPFGIRGLGADDPMERREAIREGLTWLAAHQSPHGGWEAEGYARWCDGKSQDPGTPDGMGKSLYDVGVTGLALLAFLGAGYAGDPGSPHESVVERGLEWLCGRQDAEGCVGNRQAMHYVYNHAYAAAALVEAYGMTGDARWHGAAQRALDFTARARNPAGAWRYGIRPGDDDTSATAAVMNAVRAAHEINRAAEQAGLAPPLEVDPAIAEGVLGWVERMTDPEYGRTGYIQRGGQAARPQELISQFPGELSEATTAMGILLRVTCGENPHASNAIRKGTRLLLALPPRWAPDEGHLDLYYWHYGSAALRQVGGQAWATWSAALDQALVPHQRRDTDPCRYRGSWDPIGPWAPDGGRVYATAVALLGLEAARAHRPLFPPPAGAESVFRERTLADALGDKDLDVHVRGRAIRAAARRGGAQALGAVRDALHAQEPVLRAHAARAIGTMGEDATLALPTLVAALGDPYEIVRVAALRALAALGARAASAVPRLPAVLSDPQAAVRREAAHTARAIGAKAALAALEARLADEDAGVRVAAARALLVLDGQAEKRVAVLVEALGQGGTVALEAVEGLEALGDALPVTAVERLRQVLAASTLALRLRAAEALGRVAGADALRTPAGRPDKDVRKLVDQALESGEPATVVRGLALLGTMGPAARGWLEGMAQRASLDPAPAVREAAVVALGRLGETARPAAAALYLARQDEAAAVRKAADDAIAAVKPTPGAEIPGLVEALGRSPVARRAADALTDRGGDAVPALVAALERADEGIADGAAYVLMRVGEAAVGPLVRALENPSPALRRRVATILGRVDVPARRLVPAGEGLTRLLTTAAAKDVPEIRGTLLRIGRPAVPSLLDAFAKGDAVVKARVLDALARILPPPTEVLPAFLEGLGHADEDVRRAAATGLARYGPQAGAAVAALALAVADEDADVRRAAVTALGNVGRAADDALPRVVAALKDDDEGVAKAAERALTCLDQRQVPPTALDPMEKLLSDLGSADVRVRRAAAAALVLLGGEAASAADRLVVALADADEGVRAWVSQALARLGRDGAERLATVLATGSSVARQAALDALARMGPDAAPALEATIESLALTRLRSRAVEVLGGMGKPAVSRLVRALKDERPPVRAAAAQALAHIGGDATSARTPLLKLVKEEAEKDVRQAALEALAALGRTGIAALKSLVKPPASIGLRRAAAETLGALGSEAEDALAALRSAERREKDARVKEALGAAVVRIESGQPSRLVQGSRPLPCDRRWHYLDEQLPRGVDARVEALLRFDGSPASLEDRAQRAFDLIPVQGSVQYVVEPTSGLVGLDLEDDTMFVTGEVPRNLISRGAITIEILIRSNDADGSLAVVGASGETAATNVPWFLRMVKGKLQAMHEVREGEDIVADFAVGPVDALRLLTMTRDGLGRDYALYVDGQQAGTAHVAEGPSFGDADKHFYLGPVEGVVLGLRVTGVAFTPEAVQASYERLRRE